MKSKHVAAERLNARMILKACNVAVGQDFFTLSSAQVAALLVAADVARYRQPRNANGSRGRYFHDLLQRRARREG